MNSPGFLVEDAEALVTALADSEHEPRFEVFHEDVLSRAEPSSGSGAMDGLAVDAGTYPTDHVDAEPLPPHADKQAKRAGSSSAYSAPEVRSACRCIRAASAAQHSKDSHTLRFTDRELLHLHSALSHDRNRTRKAIGKGLAKIVDLRASDTVWEKLQAVYFGRIFGRRS